MMNIFNEWFMRSTSKKIRAVWQAKGKSGERLAVIPPYGYRKDPDSPKQLVIDEESAAMVRRIYRLSVEGNGPAQIARLLNGEHVLNPSSYKYEHGIVKKARPCKDHEIAAGYCIEMYGNPAEYPNGTQDENYYSEMWIPVKRK